jgi:fermentation-respiration switch protein FrsA (DUF1100 family)
MMAMQTTKPKIESKKSIYRQVGILICLYIVLCPLLSQRLYERLLFFPESGGDESMLRGAMSSLYQRFGVTKQDVTIPTPNGKILHGWYFKMPGASKVFLISHGNAGNITSRFPIAASLMLNRSSVLLYDYEGYGKSTGYPSLRSVTVDALAAYDFLTSKLKYQPGDVIGYGESLGTGVTCFLSAHRPLAGIVLQATYPSLLYAAHDRLWFTWLYPNAWFIDLDNMTVLAQPHPPLLIVQGRKDSLFPVYYGQILFDRAVTPKKIVMPDTLGHCLGSVNDQQFMDAIKDFLQHL